MLRGFCASEARACSSCTCTRQDQKPDHSLIVNTTSIMITKQRINMIIINAIMHIIVIRWCKISELREYRHETLNMTEGLWSCCCLDRGQKNIFKNLDIETFA